jgi:two-component system NtrC family sensor kinase
MNTLGEAAMDLPWLAPSVASLALLARSPIAAVWNEVRNDPGVVLLSAQLMDRSALFSPLHDTRFLEAVLQHEKHFHLGHADWNQPGSADVHEVCCALASLASQLAEKKNVDTNQAWIAGFLSPLGWLAAATAYPGKITYYHHLLQSVPDGGEWQRQGWGHDHAGLTRRLCRSWRLPSWLSAILGNLRMPASVAQRLGADVTLFRIVQLSVLELQERERSLGLAVGGTRLELLHALGISAQDVQKMADSAVQIPVETPSWESPAAHPLLADLLRLALDNRRSNDAHVLERLQNDLDQLQSAIEQQCAGEQARLHAQKLASLAEFAAGAGHEINNPLAVISGQAQYVLKQMDWLNVPAEEIENVGEYLDNIRTKVTPSLHKIVGQTQRIHSILTELMQFARPALPKVQPVSAYALIQEAFVALQEFAHAHHVRLLGPELDDDERILADPVQTRAALIGLLRNAIEAAPDAGWARVKLKKNERDQLEFIVEDNGNGPPAGQREHLFDPFFSGRSAGRGRGMGLPTAWRLARQQGGDVWFAGIHGGATRFVMMLPLAPSEIIHTNGNGRHSVHA